MVKHMLILDMKKVNYYRHYMENTWNKKFQTQFLTIDWQKMYIRKIKNIPCMKLAEFNYKLIHNLVVTRYILNKWNKSVSEKCVFCNDLDSTEHLLFYCSRIQHMWKLIGICLKLDIRWFHIIIGLNEDSSFNIARNNIISIIVYSIYLLWVKCGNTKSDFKHCNVLNNLKSCLLFYQNIYKEFLNKEK